MYSTQMAGTFVGFGEDQLGVGAGNSPTGRIEIQIENQNSVHRTPHARASWRIEGRIYRLLVSPTPLLLQIA